MAEATGQNRRRVLLEALDWLEYRVEVCRAEEAKYDPTSRAAATERATRHELELAICNIARIGNTRRNSRALAAEVAERAAYVKRSRAERFKRIPPSRTGARDGGERGT